MFALTLVTIRIFAGAIGQYCWKFAMSNMGEIDDIGDLLQFRALFEIFTNKWVLRGLVLYAGFLWWW